MADAILQTIMEKIETKINDERVAGSKLDFMVDLTDNRVEIVTDVETFQVGFRNYAILIFPISEDLLEEIPKIGNRVERRYGVGISCRRKLTRRRKVIFFSSSNEINVPVGIVEMSNRVMDILRYNTLDATVEPHSGRQFEDSELTDEDPYMNTHDFVFVVSVLSTVTSSGVN